MTTSVSDIKGKLIAVIERGERDQAALVALLSDSDKVEIGEPDHWVVKDQIAHLNFWRDRTLRRLVAVRDSAEPPGPSPDFQPENERNFAAQRYQPWSEIIAESDRLFRETKQVIPQLTDAQLTEVVTIGTDNEIRLSERVVSDFMEHPAEHLTQLYRERGETARAEAQEGTTVEVISELFGKNNTMYGYAIYNLGCFYARAGESDRAIAAVGEALPLIPSLVEWSKQDTDLDSLRDMPAFQALYDK
jgi:DinB family protein